MKLNRILYKISGEAMASSDSFYNPEFIQNICKDIANVSQLGVEICVTIGGGNIFRGIKSKSLDITRNAGDKLGMLSTVMNAIILKDCLLTAGVEADIMSAIEIEGIETFEANRANSIMKKNRVVIFAAGIGQSYFTTDTCAVLRALQTGCDAVLKGTSVDGVYSEDPKKNPNAFRYDTISYEDVVQKSLKIMDASAILIAAENKMPIYVFSIKKSTSPLYDFITNNALYTKIN